MAPRIVTFILDIPAKDGLARSMRRQSEIGSDDAASEDRFEKLDIAFHEKLRQGFLDIAQNDPDRCFVIDALQKPDEITNRLQSLISKEGGISHG